MMSRRIVRAWQCRDSFARGLVHGQLNLPILDCVSGERRVRASRRTLATQSDTRHVEPKKDDTKTEDASDERQIAEVTERLSLAKPIDFNKAAKVVGQEAQMVTFELKPHQMIRAEAGALIYMEDGIEMDTNTGGGAGSMFRRVITGQNMFVTDYINKGRGDSKVALGTDVASKIIRLPLADYGGSMICQRGAFIAGSHTIDIQTEFTKMMAGFFGGEGFILQRLTGEGDAFVKASGPLVKLELAEGETVRVSSGCIVAFEPSVQYDVQTVPGFKNVVFGGEGLFITVLRGPGIVFLQGLPVDRMVDQIARRIPGGRGGMPVPLVGGMGSGGEEGSGEAGQDADIGSAGAAGAAGAAEGTSEDASGDGIADNTDAGSGTPQDLFGDVAPESESTSGEETFGSQGGFESNDGFEPQEGFDSQEAFDAGDAKGDDGFAESEWSEDGGGGDEGMGDSDWTGGGDDDEGSPIIRTLKKIYETFFSDE